MAIAVPAPAAGQTTGPTVTVVRLKHTGHVVAALTRTGAAPPPVAGQLTGGALPLAVPGATGLVLVPADLLTAEEPGAPPGLLTAPWHWYVDTGDPRAVAPAPPRLVEVSGDIPAVEYDAGSLRITSPTTRTPPSSSWSIHRPSGAQAPPPSSRSQPISTEAGRSSWATAPSGRTTTPWLSSEDDR